MWNVQSTDKLPLESLHATMSNRQECGARGGKTVPVREVIRSLACHPIEMIAHRWNWKSAVLSTLIRGCIFFFANLVTRLHAALGAMAAEFVYRGLASGFFGALTEAFCEAEPVWLAGLTVTLLLALGHSVEFAVHWLRGTPQLRFSMVGSVAFTGVSTLFNLYAMRRGALIAGEGGQSLVSDLRRMPGLLMGS